MKKQRNPSFWLYVIGSYIVIQFLWWAWLLIDQSSEIVQLSQQNDAGSALQRRIFMVLGEGLVFIIILFLGFRKLNQSIKKEVEMAHTQRNFLLSITHELNTPITTIKLYLQTLAKRKLQTDQRQDIIIKTTNEAERLKNLIDNILTSARIEENKLVLHPESQELKPLIESIVQPYFEIYGKERFLLNLENKVSAKVDPLAIQSVITNLIDNAIKYDPNAEVIRINLGSNQSNAEIQVADSGIGIDEKNRKAVFNKFYRVQSESTRSTKGTGLGLYISKSLVEIMQGQIEVEANLPTGSIFKIKIPLAL